MEGNTHSIREAHSVRRVTRSFRRPAQSPTLSRTRTKQPIRDRAIKWCIVVEQPHVRPRPAEAVDLARDDPALLAVEAEVALYVGGQFDRHHRSFRRAVR